VGRADGEVGEDSPWDYADPLIVSWVGRLVECWGHFPGVVFFGFVLEFINEIIWCSL